MNERGFILLDTQYLTPHLERFGAREIPRKEYMKRLEESLTITCSFTDEE
jgi:leucyl/phenylalanyl-tRNA--protein transferase